MPSEKAQKIENALKYLSAHPDQSRRAVGRLFGVHPSTLTNRLNGGQSQQLASAVLQHLTIVQEECLAEWCLSLQRAGRAPTHNELKNMAILLARASERDIQLGKRWVPRFLQRHPELKTKGSRKIEFPRMINASSDKIKAWIALVERVQKIDELFNDLVLIEAANWGAGGYLDGVGF